MSAPSRACADSTCAGLESTLWWKKTGIASLQKTRYKSFCSLLFSVPSLKLLLVSTAFALKISEIIKVQKKPSVYS